MLIVVKSDVWAELLLGWIRVAWINLNVQTHQLQKHIVAP